MSSFAALAELRALLFWRRLRGKGGLAEGIARAVLFLMAVPIGLAAAVAVGVASFKAARAGAGIQVTVGVTAIFFGVWQAWTAVALSLDDREALDLRRLLVYPVPPGRAYVLGLATGVAGDPMAAFWLLLLSGAFLGAAVGRPGVWLVALALVLAGFATCTVALVAVLQELLARLVRRRLVREVLAAAVIGFFAWFFVAASGASRESVRHVLLAVRRAQWVFFPPALAASAARHLYRGELAGALPWVVALLAAAAATVWAAYRLALGSARGGGDAAGPVTRGQLRGWSVPLLSGASAALVEKEARYLLRHPLARVYALVVPAMAALVAWKATPLIPADSGEVVRALPLFGLAAYAHLVFQIFWVNGLGFERGGARLLFLAPVDPGRVLAAKNGVLYLHSLSVFALSACTMIAVGGVPPAWVLAGALALHAGLAPALYGLGNVVTALNPRAAPLGVQRGGALPALSGLAGMAIISAATSLFSVPVLLALRLEAPWVLVGGWVVLGAACLALYLRTLPAAGRLLASRREAVLAAVCGDDV